MDDRTLTEHLRELGRKISEHGAAPREVFMHVDDYNAHYVPQGWPAMEKVPGTCVYILDGVPSLLDCSWADEE